MAAVVQKDSDIGWFHAVNAELKDTSKDPKATIWSDWKFFQYTELDIAIGEGKGYQIPKGTKNFKTKVTIGNVTSISCGQYDATVEVERTFYINQTKDVSLDPEDPPRTIKDSTNLGYLVNQTGKTIINSPDVSIELKKIVQSLDNDDQFTLNKWEFYPTSNEVMFYVFDVKDENTMNDLRAKQVGNYTIHVIHDSEFEVTRADVVRQLTQYRENSDYQIAKIILTTDRVNDPPGNYVEMWTYKSTSENEKLDNTVINGWTVQVYPVSG
jgi:hypothetical protein